MLPIVDRPMLEHSLAWLGRQRSGEARLVEQAVLSMGYKPDAILDTYADRVCAAMPFECAVESQPLGTAGGIAFGAAQANIKESFVAVNGDILCDVACAELLAAHRRNSAVATIALTQVADPSRFGVVEINPAGQVQRFVEKPGPGDTDSRLINAGIYVLEPEALEAVPENGNVSIERDVFPELAAQGVLWAHQCEGAWLDVGTPEAFLRAQFWKAGLSQGADSWPPRQSSSSYRHPEAAVADGASVGGSVVMAQVRVEAGARVERSALLPGCVIEAGATVLDSIVGAQVVVGPNAVVRDLSVIAANVEAGSTLSGARHG